jgi:hypothetical protein
MGVYFSTFQLDVYYGDFKSTGLIKSSVNFFSKEETKGKFFQTGE